jgi:hypothetical protein
MQRFGNWICFRPQVKGGRTPQLDSLERANLNHWNPTEYMSSPAHLRTETDPVFRNAVFSSFYNTGQWAKSNNPVILKGFINLE